MVVMGYYVFVYPHHYLLGVTHPFNFYDDGKGDATSVNQTPQYDAFSND
jgi:hypothetical protein